MGTCRTTHSIAAIDSKPLTHYVVIRKDLPVGFAMAQVVHAAGESTPMMQLESGTYAVVLAADNEDHLCKIANQLENACIPNTLITEVDAPYTGQHTAIGIVPTRDREKLKPILGGLKLYKH